jgi:uncharacterized protein (DUF2384 family)
MKPKATRKTPARRKLDLQRRKKLEELIAQQGVSQTATFEQLVGAGVDLWENDRDFKDFLDTVKAVRHEKG